MLPYTADDGLRAINREFGVGLNPRSNDRTPLTAPAKQAFVTTALRAIFERRPTSSSR
jgi:hypothetical protein